MYLKMGDMGRKVAIQKLMTMGSGGTHAELVVECEKEERQLLYDRYDMHII